MDTEQTRCLVAAREELLASGCPANEVLQAARVANCIASSLTTNFVATKGPWRCPSAVAGAVAPALPSAAADVMVSPAAAPGGSQWQRLFGIDA